MRIGIPAEVYPGETRVAATPDTVKKLTAGGRHSVIVESKAGVCASIPDASFTAAGASLGCASDVYNTSELAAGVGQSPVGGIGGKYCSLVAFSNSKFVKPRGDVLDAVKHLL